MWTSLTSCPQNGTSAKGTDVQTESSSSTAVSCELCAGPSRSQVCKSGENWVKGKCPGEGLASGGWKQAWQPKSLRVSCRKLPCTYIPSWLQEWSPRKEAARSAFQHSSVVGCFQGMLMVLCPILSAARKQKSKLNERVLVVAVRDLIYTTEGWNTAVLQSEDWSMEGHEVTFMGNSQQSLEKIVPTKAV